MNFAEKLRRKDAEVAKALEEKERLIADILHIPPPPTSSTNLDVYGAGGRGRICSDDIDNDDIASSDALNQHHITDKDATKVLLAALEQGKKNDILNWLECSFILLNDKTKTTITFSFFYSFHLQLKTYQIW